MNMETGMDRIIGVDVGGTLLRAGLFDMELNLLNRAELPSGKADGSDAVLQRLYDVIAAVIPAEGEVKGIGVALPGAVDAVEGIIYKAPNLPFDAMPIRRLVEDRFGIPTFLGNDADLAGLAESIRGAGRGVDVMVYLTVSTGVGGGMIINGKPLVGGGMGGEVGHMVINPDGPLCGCGKPGHVESYSSGTGMANTARRRIEAGEESLLTTLSGGDLSTITAKMINEASQQGDALSQDIIHTAGWILGAMVASLMALLNPHKFVVGGGVTKIGEPLFAPMREAIRAYALHPRYYENVEIVPAELGGNVGLVGAAALARAFVS